jgi:hypothetical protein
MTQYHLASSVIIAFEFLLQCIALASSGRLCCRREAGHLDVVSAPKKVGEIDVKMALMPKSLVV